MSYEEATRRIESLEFSALANLASNLKTFLAIVADQSAVQALLSSGPDVAAVARRARELATLPAEDGLEHPADTAVAVYLWLLASLAPREARDLATGIRQAAHFWWARSVAAALLDPTANGAVKWPARPESPAVPTT